MELRVLRYFLTVAREESITRAAEVLHITQPTLSRQLAQLEEDMGVQLLLRGKRKTSLTNEGLLLRRRGEEILELVDKTEKELTEHEEAVEGTVSIGCGDLGAMQIVSELIRSFHEKYPAVTFDLYTGTADHIRDRMERGLTDVGLLLEPVNMEKFEFIRLDWQEEWVVMHPDAPLAGLERISREDLRGLPLILPRRLDVQSEIASWFGDDFQDLNVRFTSNLPSNSTFMVYNKLAYAILVGGSNMFWDEKKVVFRPMTPPLTTSSVLAWKRRQPFALAAEKFIAFAREHL